MQVKILTNALIYGDAVSLHCLLLKQHCRDLGIEAEIYAGGFDERLGSKLRAPSPEHLLEGVEPGDLLLHQFFLDTDLISFVERFPGRRVMMYHNITPSKYFPPEDPVWEMCDRGRRLLATIAPLYDYAVGMSDYSRRELESVGFTKTGVFPLLIDAGRLLKAEPRPDIARRRDPERTTFVFLGRVSPNKKVEDLPRFLEAYRKLDPKARLVAIGDKEQSPKYTQLVESAARKAGLSLDDDFILTGKVSEEEVRGWFATGDAYVSLSEHEGFCAPLIEAMALGLPAFAFDAGASAETLANAETTFTTNDPAVMAAQAHAVLSNAERRAAVLAAQAQRLEQFSPEAQRRNLAQFFEQVSTWPLREAYRPTVSVVINTYNRAPYLERALHSLRQQTYRNFEVVVVNGPSTDDTEQRLEKFKDEIRIARTAQRVICVSRNEGIQEARGELVAFLDDDAVPQATWLDELVCAFQDPKVGAVGGMVYRWRGHDIEFRNGVLDRLGLVDWLREQPGLEFDWSRGYLNTVSGNNCIFRRSALEEIRGFDEEIEYYHDEADIVIRLAAGGYRTVHRPRAIVYHEAAGSHIRAGKYSLNWFVIVKNTLYCALKNYPEQGAPVDMAAPELKACEPVPQDRKLTRFQGTRKDLAKVVTDEVYRLRVRPLFQWWRQRELTLSQLIGMYRDCKRGIREGRAKGLSQPAKLRTFTRHNDGLLLYPAAETKGLTVCLLTQTLPHQSPGGVATYTLELAKGLRDLGCEVHLVYQGRTEDSEFKDGIWFHTAVSRETEFSRQWRGQYGTVARNLDYAYGVWRRVVEIDSRWGLDVVESPAWDFEGLFLAHDNRLPLAVRLHSPLFEVMKIQGWAHTADLDLCIQLEGSLLRHATAVYGSTNAILDLVLQHYQLRPEVTARIPLGISLDAQAAPAAAARVKKILFVGRLEPRKGIDVLLNALPGVLEKSPEAVVEIVGREIEQPGKVAKWLSGHPEWRLRVRAHGEVSDAQLRELYSTCDLFVAPSIYESFGLIYLEAMAHGKAVIGTHAGGIPEVVAHNETGILVPPGDSRALGEALQRLLHDDAERARMGAAGLARFREKFTAKVMARNTLPFYQRVVENWKSKEKIVFDAEALAMQRGGGVSVEWDAAFGSMCLKSPKGERQTLCWGPYQGLEHGRYRAQFWIHLDYGEPNWVREGWVCRFEAFAMQTGVMGFREVTLDDVGVSRTAVIDLFFEVAGPDVAGVEYRVLASGALGMSLRRIRVSRHD
ncbi:MAG: glycosyltransferase [Bryobacterales bacterium]|nr:glycosyltransferase [Bryobacterales bacterium]